MSNDCLKTTLKSSVANENLPILNTIILDDYDTENVPSAPTIVIMAGATKLHLKCKVPMYSSTDYNDGVLEMDVPANSRKVLRYKQSEIQALSSAKDFLVITGDVYHLLKIGASNFLTMDTLQKSGLDLLKYDSNLVCYGCVITENPIENLPTSVEFIQSKKVFDKWFAAPYGVKVFATGSSSDDGAVPLNSITAANTSVQTMTKVSGDIKNLPRNILWCYLVRDTNGSIEELVASMVSAGRTSGSIKFNIASSTYVTYNGERLGTIYTGNKVLVWNNRTITWQDNDTEETAAAPTTSMYAYPVS